VSWVSLLKIAFNLALSIFCPLAKGIISTKNMMNKKEHFIKCASFDFISRYKLL
jgi:hypothetical protein